MQNNHYVPKPLVCLASALAVLNSRRIRTNYALQEELRIQQKPFLEERKIQTLPPIKRPQRQETEHKNEDDRPSKWRPQLRAKYT